MPSKEYYLQRRGYIQLLGYTDEVQILDSYYNIILLYSQQGELIKIL